MWRSIIIFKSENWWKKRLVIFRFWLLTDNTIEHLGITHFSSCMSLDYRRVLNIQIDANIDSGSWLKALEILLVKRKSFPGWPGRILNWNLILISTSLVKFDACWLLSIHSRVILILHPWFFFTPPKAKVKPFADTIDKSLLFLLKRVLK